VSQTSCSVRMTHDIRDTALFREAEALYRSLRRPGSGAISDATEIATNGQHVAFAGAVVDRLDGIPPSRICLTDLSTGHTRLATYGPNCDRMPRFSPGGDCIAFLSDRQKTGDFQLYLLDPVMAVARDAPRVEGWVEYLQWSPDGKQILLGVAGHGADTAAAQGAVTSKPIEAPLPDWMPSVEVGHEESDWRRVWVYEVSTNRMRQVTQADSNVWEAAWCGNESIVAVVSPGPGEGLWYSAQLQVIQIATGNSRKLYAPKAQLGVPATAPSGSRVAIVEAICSDRWLVAGDLLIVDAKSGVVRSVNTLGVDITYTEWRSERQLLVAGHRGFESVVGIYDCASEKFTEVWASSEISTGGRYITVSGIGEAGDCVLVGESFTRAPEIAVIRGGRYEAVKSFDHGYAAMMGDAATVKQVNWTSPDGVDLQGWLLLPKTDGPHPIIMNIHGGPVWHWHPVWLGRAAVPSMMLLRRGYAVFLPNPRGGSGRGQAFCRLVVGDMGGADAEDCLSGLTHLLEAGIADSARLGVTGVSYGGYMTSWLITQDSRFAAAVAVAPVTHFVTAHLIANIPHFVRMFLDDTYSNPAGKYFQRSPVMHAHQAKTPTLNISGALDRCTPPEEAVQFHNALAENGVQSALLVYPNEGHGVRHWPASIDFAARVVGWFEHFITAKSYRQNSQ
jgi:dipeptidyl aminopeptidase/acylaminoacyl peptidase